MCIYEIVNVKNGHKYIGSALKGFEWRKRKHLRELKSHKHHNRHLQNAYDLYGEESFQFNILEAITDCNVLIQKEQEWIDKLNPIYNVMRDIKSHIGIKRSKETCEKISKSLMGKPISKSHRESISKTLTGRKQSAETIRKRMAPVYKPILQLDLNGNVIREWKSATEAGEMDGFNRKCIYRCLWEQRPTYKGFRWKRKIGT